MLTNSSLVTSIPSRLENAVARIVFSAGSELLQLVKNEMVLAVVALVHISSAPKDLADLNGAAGALKLTFFAFSMVVVGIFTDTHPTIDVIKISNINFTFMLSSRCPLCI